MTTVYNMGFIECFSFFAYGHKQGLRGLTVEFSPRGSIGFGDRKSFVADKREELCVVYPRTSIVKEAGGCHTFKTQESISDPYANVILDVCRVQSSVNLQTALSGQGLRLASRIKSSSANIALVSQQFRFDVTILGLTEIRSRHNGRMVDP